MKPTLLIADDDFALMDVFRRFLLRHDYEVRTAAGGLECLDQLREAPCEALLLGARLPWGGSDGVLAVMRDEPDLFRVPVVLTAADESSGVFSNRIAPPVVRALERPFSLALLLESVRAALRDGEGNGNSYRCEGSVPS
jgi:DNA-binding NtrC family response regulator